QHLGLLYVARSAAVEQHSSVILASMGEPRAGTDSLVELQRVAEVPFSVAQTRRGRCQDAEEVRNGAKADLRVADSHSVPGREQKVVQRLRSLAVAEARGRLGE